MKCPECGEVIDSLATKYGIVRRPEQIRDDHNGFYCINCIHENPEGRNSKITSDPDVARKMLDPLTVETEKELESERDG